MKKYFPFIVIVLMMSVSMSGAAVKKAKEPASADKTAAIAPVAAPVVAETVAPAPSYVKKVNISGSLRYRYGFYQAANSADTNTLSRARIKLTGETAADTLFVIQPDFAALSTGGNVALADAYIEMKVNQYKVKMGQFLLPFAYDSGKYKTIYSTGFVPSHYGVIVASRDYGYRMSGPLPVSGFFFDSALVNGTGSTDTNKGKDLVGRINYKTETLDVGLSGYYGKYGSTMADRKCGAIDAEYKFANYQLVAELMAGGSSASNTKLSEASLQLTGLFGCYEPLVRYETYDPNMSTANNVVNTLTLGGALIIDSSSKMLVNYNLVQEETSQIDNNSMLFELQIQI
ncbi:MAG: porin [Candidatus Margulisiibacteriota bacterium]